MARTVPDIQAAIAAARAARPALAGLSSPSATALYRLYEFVVATAIWALEMLFDRHMADVDATLARAQPGTPAWYAAKALQFQYGDALAIDDAGIHYAAGSSGPRLVARAAAKESALTNKLYLKVAKETAPDVLAPLAANEKTALEGYFERIRFAGTRLEVVSLAADKLRVAGQVYYDPLADLPTVQAAVRTALLAYLARLEFDGQVYVARLVDAIQSVPQVRDVLLTQVSSTPVTPPLVPLFDRVREAESGYFIEDDGPGQGFLDTLTFLPYRS